MSRITDALVRAAEQRRPALIGYLCAGDPSIATSEALFVAMAESGVDILEVGVPFSDPTADGPVIQRSSERALRNGTTLSSVLDLVGRLRSRAPELPIVLFGYANPILSLGEEAFLARAREVGVDGLLAVDLPFDEAVSLRERAALVGIDWIPLVAPNTRPERVAQIGAIATSFVYFISVAGVTGAASVDFATAAARANEVREQTRRPVAVGFGVRSEDDARALARAGVSGVVVGSALVREVEASATENEAVQRVSDLVRSLRRGLDA